MGHTGAVYPAELLDDDSDDGHDELPASTPKKVKNRFRKVVSLVELLACLDSGRVFF